VVSICTASLTFNNSTFCPHTVFMCFVWIWEQTAIISLYTINWLVYITKPKSVYCAVQTLSINAVRLYLALNGHTMAQAIIRRPFTWEALLRFRIRLCEICRRLNGTEICFSPSDSFFPLSVSFHHCYIHIFVYVLLLSEGQTGERSFISHRALNIRILSLLFFKG